MLLGGGKMAHSTILRFQPVTTMLIFLSPAKSLDFKTPPHVGTYTQPAYLQQSQTLDRAAAPSGRRPTSPS